MHCPDCEMLLRASGAPGREACPECAGEWFDLPLLTVELRGDSRGEEGPLPAAVGRFAGAKRHCPICRAVLRRRDWAGTLPPEPVAVCPLGHGVWLPAGGRLRLRHAAGRARHLLRSRAPFFTLLAWGAARDFDRATRPGRGDSRSRRTPLARIFT